jgi:hypothetical protein
MNHGENLKFNKYNYVLILRLNGQVNVKCLYVWEMLRPNL